MSTVVSPFSLALDNKAFLAAYLVLTSVTTEAGSTNKKIIYTGASVVVHRGDMVFIRSGSYIGYELPVVRVAGNEIELGNSVPADLGAGVTFDLLRYRSLQVGIDGKIQSASDKQEDSPHTSGDTGTLALAVRGDAASNNLVSNNGDYAPFQVDIFGRLKVSNTEYGPIGLPNFYWPILGLVEIPTTVIGDPTTGIPWSVDSVSGGGCGRVHGSTAHDAVDAGNPLKMGGKASTSIPTAVANADRVDAYFDANGRLFVNSDILASESALTTLSAKISTAAALADGTTNPTIGSYGAFPFMWDSGTSRWNRVTGTTANGVDVDVTRVSGTVTISGTVTASNTAGNVAHDGVDSGNPVKVGMKSRTAHVTAVANNDRSDWTGDVLGQAKVSLAHNTRTDTFTTAAPTNGTALGDGFQTFKYFSITVQPTGAVTSWTVVLQYSLDNVTWTTFLTHTNVTGAGVPVFSADAIPRPVFYIRSQATALVLGAGTNVIARILGVQ